MEDEERQKKLEAGKAKLAEYRQKKAHTDSQKKQKKKKKKKPVEDFEEEWPGKVEAEADQPTAGDDVSSGERYGSQGARKDPPTAEFTFTRTLHSGDSVKHDQTYTIEPESEVSTTAEDYSSEEEVEHLRQGTQEDAIQDVEDALTGKNQAEEELKQGLEEYRAAFATEEVQQLQDFEAALKQRDGIITQLTTNLQQAREEKDEIMKEFLELTEQSQKLQIQFQQLQAGETLRNTSHSSTAADLLQARQQLVQYQQQLEEMNVEIRKYQESNNKQLEEISQLQHNVTEMEMLGRSSEESFTQRTNEKALLIAEQEKIITRQEESVTELKTAEELLQQTMQEKEKLIIEQRAIISEHEQSLTFLRDELVRVKTTAEDDIIHMSDKDQIIAEQGRVISERDCCITQLQDELESSEKRLHDFHQRMSGGELEFERCLDELETLKCDLNSSKSETESCKLELENAQKEVEIYKNDLANSKQKERMSSNEIMQLMGTVEELQKRNHQGTLSEGDTIQKIQEETAKKLEFLRAELDEMYGQQIVQMKQELNLQHAAKVEEMAAHHQNELEFIKAQSLSYTSNVGTVEVETLKAKIQDLQLAREQSEETHEKTRHELSKVSREKLGLQSKVEELLRDLSSAKQAMELASSNLMSQESQQDELQHLQDTLSSLQCQLAAAHETTKETEAKHESEVTNYKIKLEMLEREKDAVLGRMAESQEAELERLRTQLLFSHEEELTVLREELQRENCQNAENLLQEAAVKHERALKELHTGYEEQLNLFKREKASAATERDELLHQIQVLKEDLNQVLDDSKAEEAVQQLHELRLELEELRKQERKQTDIENEIQTLLQKREALENKAKEQEDCWQNKFKEWELEKASLEEQLGSKNMEIETLEAQRKELQQQISHLCDEAEKQRTTFSFAEKNFEVNYQELKEEYTCLMAAKTQLEEKMRKQTFEFEAKIASLQSQIEEVDGSRTDGRVDETSADGKVLTEKDATELMEKFNVSVGEKESLAVKISEVTEQLMISENKVGQLEEELLTLRRENKQVIAQNDSLAKELDREQRRGQAFDRKAKLHQVKQSIEPAALVCSVGDHHLQIQSLQGEVEALQSLLRAAEAEKDGIRQTPELQRLKQTPSPASVQSPGEEPVEGRSSPQKSSAHSRRKRRQRSKQERKLFSTDRADSREETQREEEEEEGEEALVEEETATSAAEPEMQSRIQPQVLSCSQERAGGEDSTDGNQGDRGREHSNRQMRSHAASCHMEPVLNQEAEEDAAQHGECRLQMEAQRISLSQIHAAQLELLQEETDYYTWTPKPKEDHDQDEPKIFKYQKLLDAVSEESRGIILSLQKMLGEELSENVDSASKQLSSVETPECSDSNSVLLCARELYKDLQQVKVRIEQEYDQLLQLQVVLRGDGNKMTELQTTYNELKSSSEKEIADLHMEVASFSLSASKDPENLTGAQSPSLSVHLQRLQAEAQELKLQLEESHRREMEHLRAHYQQQATETEQRCTAELSVLEQQLQEVTDTDSYNRVTEPTSEKMEVQTEKQKALSEQGGAGLLWSTRTVGLTAQLQALRKALYNKCMQEVATLKEQHSKELRRLREEREQERKASERLQEKAEAIKVEHDADNFNKSGCSTESLGTTGRVLPEEKRNWEKVEEEVAKVIVQMSVQFAQQTELAQISRRSCQTNTSMQTECNEEVITDEKEARTPRVSPTSDAWMEEGEKEALAKELEERNAEIETLKEELQKANSKHQVLKHSGVSQQEVEEEEDEPSGQSSKQSGHPEPSSQDDGESTDKDILPSERILLRKTNEKLCQVLVDVLKTTAAAEETIGVHMQSLHDASSDQHTALPQSPSQRATWQRANTEPLRPQSAESCHSSQTVPDDVSVWSRETGADEDLEMYQQVMDSLLLGVGSQLENEEYLMSISSRLQTALEKMLTTITDTTNQLEHARVTQTELMRESFHQNREISDLLQKQEELQERVLEEERAREHLAHELQRAEGLLDGYTGERAALEEQLRHKEELQLSLEQELQVTSSQLHELEQERLQMQQERELLARQQEAMKEHAGPRELRLVEAAMVAAPEADLLEETEKLMKEKVEVQLQAEKESTDLLKQVKLLEVELEEQANRVIELEHAQKTEGGDLRQQIQALEKQLEKNRRFLDEQAVDREHERDFFQQEIQKLEQQLKSPQKLQAGSERRNQEVEQLTSQLKEKADWCSELLLSSEQLRRELGERDEEIDKLESRIRELEQALLASAESLEKVEQKNQHGSPTDATDATNSTLEAQLQTEREALERKEKEIGNLEEQLEQFREELENKSEEVQLLHMQLEIQRKELSSQQQYLETRDSMIQVMEEKDREISLLNEKITKLQHMGTSSDSKEIDARDELIKELESQVECMRSEQERVKMNNVEELDQLNAVIDRLQQELANIEQKQSAEEDEEAKSSESGPCQEEYDDMKKRMELASKELVALQTEHSKLREMHQQLDERSAAFGESEKSGSSEFVLEDVLREKTAHLVVLQAEVQALEESATSRVEELTLRIQELEDLVDEKDCELAGCRLLREETPSQAGGHQQKVSSLEENLSERMAAAIVSQATHEALQHQASDQDQGSEKDQHRPVEPQVVDFGNFTIPQLDFSNLGQARQAPTGKVVHLTQKLRDLEVGLSGIQKDQELQKQLLSSSEEEVMEYERRLAVLMDLLSQMKTKTTQRTSLFVESMSADGQPTASELLQELQMVRDEAMATEEQLSSYKEDCSRLQEELQVKTATVERLKDQLQRVSSGSSEEGKISDHQKELAKAQNEAAATKEELNSFRESCEKLQELLQEREITIAHLKDAVNQHITAEDDGANMMEVLQELQELRKDSSTTKEQLSSSKQHIEKLVNDLQVREDSICKLREELEEVSKTMDATKEELCSSKQHIEKLEEDVQVRELSIYELREELEEVRKNMDTIKEERCSPKEHKEEHEDDVEVHELSISKLREELEEVRKTMDVTKEELCSSKQHIEKLEDDVQVRELSICELREELEEVRKTMDAIKEERCSPKEHKEEHEDDVDVRELSISKLREELEEVRKTMDVTKEELCSSKQHSEKLEDDVHARDVSISELREELEEVRMTMDAIKEERCSPKEHNKELEDDVHARDISICKLREELEEVRKSMDATKEELDTSKQHSEKLEDDVQIRELSICKLREELQEVRKTVDTTKEELSSSRQHSEKLEEDLQDREVDLCNLKEELQKVGKNMDTTKEELNSSRQHVEQLREDLQERDVSLHNLKEELQEVKKCVDTTKEELNSSRQQNEKLQNDLQAREVSVSKLKEALQEARTALTKATDLSSKSPSPSPQLHSSASSISTTQPKRKGGKQLTVKGSSAKDKQSVSRKTSSSSSQSSSKTQSPRQNGFSERHRVAVTDTFTQTDAVQMSDLGRDNKPAPTTTKEEMEEVIGEFQEKIDQMQELHAAEILDMEARHISESEILRRDTQALEDDCKALKTIIDKLRSGEGPLSRPDRPTSLLKDGYTSDSSSDYSQRTGYDLPSLQQEFRTTPEGARREPDDPLPDRIKTLLREVHQEGMQVLSLSELPVSEGEPTSQLHIQGWAKERQDLLANIEALKDLIAQMKKNGETQASGSADWRQELLEAVRLVFVRERSILKNALYSQLDLLDTNDAIIHLNHLERRLAEQDAEHREAMSALHTAERSSLISEIQQLRDQLQQLHPGAKPVVSMPDESSVKMQAGGGGGRVGGGGRGEGATEANRLLVEELKCELSQTKLELETTLKAQHKYLKELDTLRTEVSQKAAEADALNDQLSDEKKRVRELQWTVEKEMCRTGRSEESKREELEDLHLTVEEQKSHVAQLTSALEQERQVSSRLSQQTDQELLNLRQHLQELQVQLDTERAKAQELSIALAREQGLRQRGPPNKEQVEGDRSGLSEEGSLLERLQRELDDKHAQVVNVLSQLEAQRLEVIRKEAELTSVRQGSRRDQEVLLQVRSQLQNLETQLSEVQQQLEREKETSRRLQEEKEQLEERLVELGGQRGGGSDDGGTLHSDNHSVVWRSDPTGRTKDWVFEQKSRNDPSVSLSMPTHLDLTQSGHTGGSGQDHHGMADKLRLISSKIRTITSKTPGSLTTEVNSEDLTWVQSRIDEVITMLQQSQSVPSVSESVSLLAGGSSSSLTERLLRQNAELTGFVSRLTEEKNDLRNHTLRLEEELRRYRQAGLGAGGGLSSRRGILSGDSAGLLLSQEREAWTREKTRLEKSLHAVQAQVARLRGEIRTNMVREITGPEADNAALKRMYGKYLRSESFRKALIYQKKYLLLLLGGFQECEEATLSLLCRMGGRPSLTAVDSGSQRRRALMRFRSVVRVSIALSRMRFLVKRWQRAAGVSSATSGAISKNAAGQAMGTDVRDSPYLHPGSVEVYRERGGGGVSGSRGRSGRESPRSACSPHHRFHVAGDHGALTCSHLQSYDPDRALTDYISRLEALQRRLGSVTSGASSYAHLHFGLRR